MSSIDFDLEMEENPIIVFSKFHSAFPNRGSPISKSVWLFEESNYFPPLLAKFGIDIQTDIVDATIMGPLFIYSFAKTGNKKYTEPNGIPLQAKLSV